MWRPPAVFAACMYGRGATAVKPYVVFGQWGHLPHRFWRKVTRECPFLGKVWLGSFLVNVWASRRFTHAWCDHRCVYGHGIGAAPDSVRRRPACRTACQKTRPAGAAKRHDVIMADVAWFITGGQAQGRRGFHDEHACSGLADQIHAVNRMGATVPVAVHSGVWRKSSWQNFV